MSRNTFQDPVGQFASYPWPVNHTAEAEVKKDRQIQYTSPTANASLIPQQGEPLPLTMSWTGTIFDKAQLAAMLFWWELCELRTIYLTDFAGDKAEILITSFAPVRKGVVSNPRVQNQPWLWTYTFDFDVITAITGTWVGVTP